MINKLILLLALILAGLSNARAQNPALGDPDRGTTKVGAKIGINTNGATAGQVVTYNGTAVVWGAGGGGGGSVITNIANNWSGINTFNAASVFSNMTILGPSVNMTNNASAVLHIYNIRAAAAANTMDLTINPVAGTFVFSQNSSTRASFGSSFLLRGSDGADAISERFLKYGNGAGEWNMSWAAAAITNNIPGSSPKAVWMVGGGTNMFELTPTTMTLGFNSGTAYTLPGSTVTAANGLNFNTDTLWFNASKMVNIGTNSASQAALTIQMQTGNTTGIFLRASATSGFTPLVIRDNTGGANIFSVTSAGAIQFGGNSSIVLNANSLSLVAAGLETLIRNNSGTASSAMQLQGGSHSTSYVRIDGGSTTEQLRINSAGLLIGITNVASGRVGIQTSGYTNFPVTPGTIAAQGNYVTNMLLQGIAVGAMVGASPTVDRAGLVWQATCTNAGTVTVTIGNYSSAGIDPGLHTIHTRFFQP